MNSFLIKTVLIVDDEPAIRKMLCMHLIRSGYKVIEASNGSDAFKLAKEVNPDLIIMDILMPQMDGSILSGLLKESKHTNRIPIIFLTALQKSQEEPNPTDAHWKSQAVFAKPVDLAKLTLKIKEILEG